MPAQTAYFVHISDTHIGPSTEYEKDGHNPYRCARRLVEIINGLPQQPDFVIHTGDVVYDPDPQAYLLAAHLFAELEAPIYYVVGNHDRAQDIHHLLPMGPRQDLVTDRDLLSYLFEAKGYRFLVVDARGPDEIVSHGLFSGRQLQLVRDVLAQDEGPIAIFTHFPIFPLDSRWMDANMLTLNGPEFHEIVRGARDRVRGVFHGHVHQHMQTVRDGVVYFSGASAFSQLAAWPDDAKPVHELQAPPAYAFVHLLPQQTIVHQHTFQRPNE